MGIHVYTAPLAAHLGRLQPKASFARTVTELTSAAVLASRGSEEGRLGFGAVWRVNSLMKLTRAPRVRVGHPWSPSGPAWMMEPDKVDARCWLQTLWALDLARSGVRAADAYAQSSDRDPADWPNLWDPKWDDLPGVLFVRAVETAQALVIPGMTRPTFFTGGVAISSTAEAKAFLGAARMLLNVDVSTLDNDYDPDELPTVSDTLYNLRLFHYQVSIAEQLSLPFGIFG